MSTDRQSKHYLEAAMGERHQSQAKRRVFSAVVVEANNLNTDNAVLVQCDGYLNLIGARYLNESRWKGIEATDVAWGYRRRCRIDLTGCWYHQGW